MKNFKLFLESRELESIFKQEIINGSVTISSKIENNLVKIINGDLELQTSDFGNLSNIEVKGMIKVYIDNDADKLNSFKNFPKTCTILNCNNQNITSFLNCPIGDSIDVNFNRIESFEHLSSLTKEVYCSNNNLTSLEYLPDGIESVYYADNKVKTFKYLPKTVTHSIFKLILEICFLFNYY